MNGYWHAWCALCAHFLALWFVCIINVLTVAWSTLQMCFGLCVHFAAPRMHVQCTQEVRASSQHPFCVQAQQTYLDNFLPPAIAPLPIKGDILANAWDSISTAAPTASSNVSFRLTTKSPGLHIHTRVACAHRQHVPLGTPPLFYVSSFACQALQCCSPRLT